MKRSSVFCLEIRLKLLGTGKVFSFHDHVNCASITTTSTNLGKDKIYKRILKDVSVHQSTIRL